jgi:maltooligosyltrehalose trehalohydrolase
MNRAVIEVGARYQGQGYSQFRVWAPLARQVELHKVNAPPSYSAMQPKECGYYEFLTEALPGCDYLYRLDGQTEFADPASRFQPQGILGPSRVVDHSYSWDDHSWRGLPLEEYIIYELHVGTYTKDGTFEAAIPQLEELVELGITAVELMPVAQFPGNRNWGYDGVFPFAVQDSYGGPEQLKRLVNACHYHGLAVILDVVYNHLGPEGNYLARFGPYFTDRYQTPWGNAINFDGPFSDEVRSFFILNALYWITEFRFDALRLDAVHAIFDQSAVAFLQELSEAVHCRAKELNRQIYLIAESSLNDSRLVRPRASGGLELDAQWNDDFHHALHTLLTSERSRYYQDYGSIEDLAKSFRDGYVYSGEYSSYRKRRHGNVSRDLPAYRFVVCAQNHDQIGNRLRGERLSQLVSFDSLKLAAAVLLLSPYLPLLFMGEEYGETAPFLYFTSHSDPELIEAIKRGRRQEFCSFEPENEIRDTQSELTFEASKLQRNLKTEATHQTLLNFYRELLRLRKSLPSLAVLTKRGLQAREIGGGKALWVQRKSDHDESSLFFNFADSPITCELPLSVGEWEKLLDSADQRWLGKGSSIQASICSSGMVTVSVDPKAFFLLRRQTGSGKKNDNLGEAN